MDIPKAVFALEPCGMKDFPGRPDIRTPRLVVPGQHGVPVKVTCFYFGGDYDHPPRVGPLDHEKTLMIAAGLVVITTDDGRTETLGPGQAFHLPMGRWYKIRTIGVGFMFCHHSATPGGPLPDDA